MDSLTSAVVIAGLATVGKPTVESLTAILGKILAPSADAVGEGIAAPLHAWAKRRGERAAQTLLDAADLLENAGIQPQRVPEKVLLPILEHSSVEEEAALQKAWVALLANAAIPDNRVIPGFASILNQLTPTHANILHWMYAKKWADFTSIDSTFALSSKDESLLLADFYRLQLLEPRQDFEQARMERQIDSDHYLDTLLESLNPQRKYDRFGFTPLGMRFMEACTPPKTM